MAEAEKRYLVYLNGDNGGLADGVFRKHSDAVDWLRFKCDTTGHNSSFPSDAVSSERAVIEEVEPERFFLTVFRDAKMAPILDMVLDERAYQDRKWGTIATHGHAVGSWLTILDVILHRARSAWVGRKGDGPSLDEIRKLAAFALACLEQHGCPPRPKGDMEWATGIASRPSPC